MTTVLANATAPRVVKEENGVSTALSSAMPLTGHSLCSTAGEPALVAWAQLASGAFAHGSPKCHSWDGLNFFLSFSEYAVCYSKQK